MDIFREVKEIYQFMVLHLIFQNLIFVKTITYVFENGKNRLK